MLYARLALAALALTSVGAAPAQGAAEKTMSAMSTDELSEKIATTTMAALEKQAIALRKAAAAQIASVSKHERARAERLKQEEQARAVSVAFFSERPRSGTGNCANSVSFRRSGVASRHACRFVTPSFDFDHTHSSWSHGTWSRARGESHFI